MEIELLRGVVSLGCDRVVTTLEKGLMRVPKSDLGFRGVDHFPGKKVVLAPIKARMSHCHCAPHCAVMLPGILPVVLVLHHLNSQANRPVIHFDIFLFQMLNSYSPVLQNAPVF